MSERFRLAVDEAPNLGRVNVIDHGGGFPVPRLTSLTFAYPEVPASQRGRLLDPRLPARAESADAFVLATCLRVEVVWSGGPELISDVMAGLYEEMPVPAGKMRTDGDAFLHLSRIAAGLESALVGETEVLTQFRQALRVYIDHTSEGNELARLLAAAIGIGRSARRSLDTKVEGSLATVAARMVGAAPTTAILGGGTMARAAAELLGDGAVSVFARRPEAVAGITPRPWSEMPEALASYTAVISTVPGPVLDDVLEGRDKPQLFVDLGMPPALDQPIDGLDYVGIDQLASSIEPIPAASADEVAAREAAAAWQRLTVSDRAGSIISSVVDRAEQTVAEEVDRYIGRLATAPDPERVLRQLARSVARRILHPSVSYVGSTPLEQSDLDVVARAFGVERD